MSAPRPFPLALLLALALASCASGPAAPSWPERGSWSGGTLVRCQGGLLSGRRSGAVLSWLGVRYAAPPTADLRWKGPQPLPPWEGIRSARRPGPRALQIEALTGRFVGSEDCLRLNLWRPDGPSSRLPVYVWIHGGANCAGYSDPEGDYEGARLAAAGRILVVSIDYRLGPLGWLEDADLVPAGSGGNLGLLDILAALEWVRANAASFGGDPGNVTVAGESAGAADILCLLLCERSRGLFSRAILESPLDLCADPARARKESWACLCRALVRSGKAPDLRGAEALMGALSPADKAALFRSLPAASFLAGLDGGRLGMYDWPGPILDGTFLPREGYGSFDSGDYPTKVPLVMGWNRDEVGAFLFLEGRIPTGTEAYGTALSYGSSAWGARWAEGLASRIAGAPGQPPVRLYRFDWGSAGSGGKSALPGYFGTRLGAFHSLEIPFFLGNDTIAGRLLTGLLFTYQNDRGRKALSAAIGTYLSGFARTGRPSAPAGLPDWPAIPPSGLDPAESGAPWGLAFGGDAVRASVRTYGADESAASRLEAVKASSPEATLASIRALLPAFMRNVWKEDSGS